MEKNVQVQHVVPTVKALRRFRRFLAIFITFLLINLSSVAWVWYKGNHSVWPLFILLVVILALLVAIWPTKRDFNRARLNDFSRWMRIKYPEMEDRKKYIHSFFGNKLKTQSNNPKTNEL